MTLINSALRQRAEALALTEAGPDAEQPAGPAPSLQQTIHDLRVYQIELEVQNEQLRQTQEALNAEQARYFDFYDLAPVGYVSLSEAGQILQANLTTVRLLGVDREQLLLKHLNRFIHPQDQDIFYLFRRQVWSTRAPQSCELRLLGADSGALWTELKALVVADERDGPVCRIVLSDITERRQWQTSQLARAVEGELAVSRQRLRELVALNEAAREEERKHIAREVHDELGQVLTALRMDLSLLEMRHGSLTPGLGGQVQGMKALVDRAIQGVRNVATHLRPTALDMGLGPALAWLCEDFSRRAPPQCSFEPSGGLEVDALRSVVVFRIVQESLTNISRYAKASQVKVSLCRRGHELRLQVIDNGQGFDVEAALRTRSFGLLGMHERAISLGGSLEISSQPGQGSVLTLSMPFEAEASGGGA